MFDDNSWFITGGYDETIEAALATTEMKLGGVNVTLSRANMPIANHDQDIIVLNQTEAVAIGGHFGESTVYYYNRDSNVWDSTKIQTLPSPLDG